MNRDGRADSLVLAWARHYTRGLPDEVARRRIDELRSDCHEQRCWGSEIGASPAAVATSMVARTLAGIPADLQWRTTQRATLQDRSPAQTGRLMSTWLRHNWWVAIAAILASILIVFGIGLPIADGTTGSVIGGIVIAACGVAILAGIAVRRQRRVTGDVLIALGTLPCYPFFWTIFLPVLGLLVLIPALVDASHASAIENAPAGQPRSTEGPGDWLFAVLVAVTIAATVGTVVVGGAIEVIVVGVLIVVIVGYRMSRGRARSV